MRNNGLKKNRIIKLFLSSKMWLKVRPWIYCYGAPLPVVVRNKRKLRKLKDKYKGKRCFIMGNGPSLKAEDLELLKNEYCFGQNKIYKIFPQTSWRPTFYCVQDFEVIDEMGDELKDNVAECGMIFARMMGYSKLKNKLKNHLNKVFFVPIFSQNIDEMQSYEEIKFSSDASKYVFDGNTVTYLSMQLATYMGFENIYLIGMDFSFPLVVDSQHNLVEQNSVDAHFYETADEYKAKTSHFKTIHGMPREIQEGAYKTAYHYCQGNGHPHIYNATRGGKLEIFDRIKLESLFE